MRVFVLPDILRIVKDNFLSMWVTQPFVVLLFYFSFRNLFSQKKSHEHVGADPLSKNSMPKHSTFTKPEYPDNLHQQKLSRKPLHNQRKYQRWFSSSSFSLATETTKMALTNHLSPNANFKHLTKIWWACLWQLILASKKMSETLPQWKQNRIFESISADLCMNCRISNELQKMIEDGWHSVYKGFFLNYRRVNRETKFDETTKNAATCLDEWKYWNFRKSHQHFSIYFQKKTWLREQVFAR